MGIIKDRHIAFRDANLAAFKKRHKHLRFAGTAKANTKGGKAAGK